MQLEPLPKDGAVFRCSFVDYAASTSLMECNNMAVGLIPMNEWEGMLELARARGHSFMRSICEKHEKLIEETYA